ncbi:MAG TPA: hypothetical protein VGF75_04480 [Candidatus Saccharimonadales bacterium]|jgi:hypothetical protein
MKLRQKDIIALVVALIAGVFMSLLVDKFAFSNSASQNTEVDVVPTIHTDFPAPSIAYYNSQAVDPTQIINISPNSSSQPFNTSSNQ